MTEFKWPTKYESLLLALAPLLGLLATYFYELGSFSYFDVPKAFLEISTPKVIAAVLGVASFFSVYIVSWAEDFRLSREVSTARLVLWHLIANALLTAIFWLKPSNNLSETVLLGIISTIIFTIGTVWLFKVVSKYRPGGERSVSLFQYLLLSLYLFVMFSAAAFFSGYIDAKGERYWLARTGTTQILVGTFNGQYILKSYKPDSFEFVKGQVTLHPADSEITFQKLAKPR